MTGICHTSDETLPHLWSCPTTVGSAANQQVGQFYRDAFTRFLYQCDKALSFLKAYSTEFTHEAEFTDHQEYRSVCENCLTSSVALEGDFTSF